MVQLCVSIDHIASFRQIRGGKEPDPIHAAVLAELAGAKGIYAHLREDRRHIQDRDVYLLKQTVTTSLNLAISPSRELVKIALDVCPHMVTIIPEIIEERTVDAGLNIRGKENEFEKSLKTFYENNIIVCLFIDPDIQQVKSAARIGVSHIELNAAYFSSTSGKPDTDEFCNIQNAVLAAHKYGLTVTVGRGLTYHNVLPIASIANLYQVNIGYHLISRALLTGMDRAVRDMIDLL